MKEFVVTIDRIVKQFRTLTIKAESKEQAYEAATDIAVENEGWAAREYEVKYEINLEEVPNFYIDRYGNPYDCEDPDACWPAGGGLHKDCEFNADALYAYYVVKSRENIKEYLMSKGFELLLEMKDFQEWAKGNTRITFEDYDNSGKLWGYLHTELIED